MTGMTNKKTDPSIALLDPTPTDEDRSLWRICAAALDEHSAIARYRVAAARQAIEWCLCRLRDNGCYNTEMDSCGPDEYIREFLAAHDAAIKELSR